MGVFPNLVGEGFNGRIAADEGKCSQEQKEDSTGHGVIMAAAILKSEIADKSSVKVVEAFVAMRRFLAANAPIFQRLEHIEYKLLENDHKFDQVFAKLEEKALADAYKRRKRGEE